MQCLLLFLICIRTTVLRLYHHRWIKSLLWNFIVSLLLGVQLFSPFFLFLHFASPYFTSNSRLTLYVAHWYNTKIVLFGSKAKLQQGSRFWCLCGCSYCINNSIKNSKILLLHYPIINMKRRSIMFSSNWVEIFDFYMTFKGVIVLI